MWITKSTKTSNLLCFLDVYPNQRFIILDFYKSEVLNGVGNQLSC